MTSAAPTIRKSGGNRPPQRRVYGDAVALVGSSTLSAGLGMLFWLFAVRVVLPSDLGVQTAILAAIMAPAMVVGTGVGDAFTALLPRAGGSRLAVLRTGYRRVATTSVLVGVATAIASVTLLEDTRGSASTFLLVVAGTVIWSFFVVQDCALTAMGRARWLPIENGIVSVGKIALLPVLAVGLMMNSAVVISTLVPALAAIAVLTRRLFRMAATTTDDVPAEPALERQFGPLSRRLMAAGAMTIGAMTILPFVVTAISGPVEGAVFALCLTIVQGLDFVAGALGVSMVVHGRDLHSSAFPHLARAVLGRTLIVVAAAAAVLMAVGPFVLRFLGETYVESSGTTVLSVLAAGAVLRTIFIIWSALQRARRATRALLIVNSFAMAVLYIAVGLLVPGQGAVGAAIALFIAQIAMTLCAIAHLVWTSDRWNAEEAQ